MSEQSQQQQPPKVFNPREHLIQLKSREGSSDYLPVQWRLVWFREKFPQGTIDTFEKEIDLDRECEAETWVWNPEKRKSEKTIKRAKGYARFHAIVTDGLGGRGTGTKSETAASFSDYQEKAETGAVGRALASLGYGTQFAPDFDEGDIRLVDAPTTATSTSEPSSRPTPVSAARPTSSPPPTTSHAVDETPATEQQWTAIEKLSTALGKQFPPEQPVINTFGQAKAYITALSNEQNQQRRRAS